MQTVYAWNTLPDADEISRFLTQHRESKLLVFRLPENRIFPSISSEHSLFSSWQHVSRCVQFDTANFIRDFAAQTDLLLLPFHLMPQLRDYVASNIYWQTSPIDLAEPTPSKIWQKLPEHTFSGSPNVLVIGAGIAGAACAFELATRGAKVCVLEAHTNVANKGSGNQQGLLYAKISAHLTTQTELLLAGYGYTRRLLEKLLPEQTTWQACGVLHLNHNANETQRNAQLAI